MTVTGEYTENKLIREAITRVSEEKYPDGVYISVKLTEDSLKEFNKYLNKHLPEFEHTPDPHLTLVYSKQPFTGVVKTKQYNILADFKSMEIFGVKENAIVAELTSPELSDRNAELVKEYKFVSDFDTYKPHITLAYDVGDFDITTLPPMNMKFIFCEETVEPLNTDWS